MGNHGGHQLFANSKTALLFDDEDIRQPGKRRKICNHPGKADLPVRLVNSKTQRMFN